MHFHLPVDECVCGFVEEISNPYSERTHQPDWITHQLQRSDEMEGDEKKGGRRQGEEGREGRKGEGQQVRAGDKKGGEARRWRKRGKGEGKGIGKEE